ncbi:hypothetical protein CCR94_13590 [Rhodoblastus sphagnicola]|uniref:Uncharacterized protein n=1 Tax=Rhodoblastus sphagnicola TaxID=333368 RepID=A0A2S6N5Z9_9HYPH|nr:DUF1190 domain-containing protein [Rhodoblastus sphagnicola]MBB4196394.1 hypothetical protein [Rhodoblastus sphagnicola]PPQ30040.1 hypothetical protein CCR94_13590 [Rhodoblastus sphagnicola]
MSLLVPALARAQASRLEVAHFFATLDACRNSGVFSAADCAAAFDRVAALMRERAPRFSDRIDCVLSFRSCERQDGSFRPAMLGVEMIKGRRRPIAMPALAVETPAGLFADPKPEAASPEPNDAPRRPRSARASPYGDLVVNANLLAPNGPPTLANYRRLILSSRLIGARAAAR